MTKFDVRLSAAATRIAQPGAAAILTLAFLLGFFSLGISRSAGVTLAQALNATNLVWTTGGFNNWFVETNVTHDGVAAQSGGITNSQDTWIQTQVTGPANLSFWWKVSSEHNFDFLEFYLGSNFIARISGEVDWQPYQLSIPEGSWTLRWRYSKDLSDSAGSDAGWLDQITLIPTFTLAQAIDVPTLQVTSGGPFPWFGQTNVTHDGLDAAQAGRLTDSETNWMQLTVNGPGTVSFWWKVSSEQNYDFLQFCINGVVQSQISGEVGWTQQSVVIPAGPQTLLWQYAKDPSTSAGQDTGWVDQLVLPAGNGSSFALSEPVTLPSGAVQLTLVGTTTNASYVVLYSSNLFSWSTAATLTAFGNTAQVIDFGAVGLPMRFYRGLKP